MQLYFPNENVGRLLAAFLVAVVLFRPEQSWPDNQPAAAQTVAEAVADDGFRAGQGKTVSDTSVHAPNTGDRTVPDISSGFCQFGGLESGIFLAAQESESVDLFSPERCAAP